eukprot:817546-Alexandrium_andersonii.AAC.1
MDASDGERNSRKDAVSGMRRFLANCRLHSSTYSAGADQYASEVHNSLRPHAPSQGLLSISE